LLAERDHFAPSQRRPCRAVGAANRTMVDKSNQEKAAQQCETQPGQVQEICEAFWAIERKLSLLSWKVHGVSAWPLLRMQTYYATTRKVGLYDEPHPGIRSHEDASLVA